MGTWPPRQRAALVRNARLVIVPAGRTLTSAAQGREIGLVVDGLLRVYVSAPNGPELTIAYSKRGDIMGTALLVDTPAFDASAQTLTATQLAALDGETLRTMMKTDVHVAWLIAEQLGRELRAAIAEIEFNSFADLRQRVARQVLNLAVPQGNDLVARVTQQQLADAVGSVREAVARVLRELRWAEILESRSGSIYCAMQSH